jgi:hypothetical protein
MEVAVTTALVAGGVALSTAIGTIWSSVRNAERTAENARAIERLKIENDRQKSAMEEQKRISKFSEPFARAAYDLQSRLYNIVRLSFIQTYLVKGNDRERSYVINNTTFLMAQYACWAELVRREIQFIDLGESVRTRQLVRLQDDIFGIWGSDSPSPSFRMFAGELRAIGEALCQVHEKEQACMGYGAFLVALPPGSNALIDALRSDVLALESGRESSAERLQKLQHALVDLLELLDPQHIRFASRRRSKA